MACHLSSAKLLPEPMMTYYDPTPLPDSATPIGLNWIYSTLYNKAVSTRL